MKNTRRLLHLVALLLACIELDSFGATKQSDVGRDLAQTIAPLFSITLQNFFVASRWDRPGTANVVEFRSLIPFKVWDQENLIRVDIPFRTASELGPGLSDVRFFDLVMFKTDTAIWGVGPVFNLGINRGPGTDSLQAGPAATFISKAFPSLSMGLLNQNFFSGQVAFSALQPILSFDLNQRWTIGLGELPIVYNWKNTTFAVFSVGLQLGVLVDLAKQPVRFFMNPQYNTRSNSQLYQWTIALGMTLPLSLPTTLPSSVD